MMEFGSGICNPKRLVVRFISYALVLSEDKEVDYHEGVDEHEGYCHRLA